MEKITKEDMAGKLTCDLGVGVGEPAADDDLVRLRSIEVTVGFGELAEEVTDVALGTLVQGLEVGRKLNGGVSAEMRKRTDGDLRCSIDRERWMSYPRRGWSGGGAPEDPSPARLLLAICSEEGGKARVFGGLEEGEGKGSFGRWRNYSADGVIYSLKWGR